MNILKVANVISIIIKIKIYPHNTYIYTNTYAHNPDFFMLWTVKYLKTLPNYTGYVIF